MNNKTFRNHISQQCGFNSDSLEKEPVTPNESTETGKELTWPPSPEEIREAYRQFKPGKTQQDLDRETIDTIDTEAPSSMCWTDEQQAAWSRELDRDKAKPYALQVCNAGAMPESFEDWIKQGNDAIDDPGGNIIPSRVQSNHDRYDNERHPFA